MKLRTFVRFACVGVAIFISTMAPVAPNSERDNENEVHGTWGTKVLRQPTDSEYREGCTSVDWRHAPNPFCEMECNLVLKPAKWDRCNKCYCVCSGGPAVPTLEPPGRCTNCPKYSECERETALYAKYGQQSREISSRIHMDVPPPAQDTVILMTGSTFLDQRVTASRNVEILDPRGICKIDMKDLPGDRMGHSINYLPTGEVLICGGYWGWEAQNKIIFKDCLVLNPTTKSFVHHSNISFETKGHVGLLLNQTLWLVGVWNEQNRIVKLEGNKWEIVYELDDIPAHGCLVAVNDTTFISIGGFTHTGEIPPNPVRSFNIKTMEWKNLAPNPNTGRNSHICLFIPPTDDYRMGRIMLQGGLSHAPKYRLRVDYVEEVTMYDIDTGTWSKRGKGMKSREGRLLMVDGRIFRVWGVDDKHKIIDTIQEFHLGNNTWTTPGIKPKTSLTMIWDGTVIPRSKVC